MDNNIIQFGKYKGSTFKKMLSRQGYIKWCLQNIEITEDTNDHIKQFLEYIKIH